MRPAGQEPSGAQEGKARRDQALSETTDSWNESFRIPQLACWLASRSAFRIGISP